MIAAMGSAPVGFTTAPAPEEAVMEEHFVWMTTRRIKPGALADFERAWRPDPYPEGLRHAYAYWSADGQEVIGVSFWDSHESCDAWRTSEAEARRHQAMAPFIVEEREAFYYGRELAVPMR
jgi:heme-degrading monooxygenase HmoA